MSSSEEEQRKDVVVRAYNPKTDFEPVKRNLQADNMFDEEWDSEERLEKSVSERPKSILIAEEDGEVIGSIFQTDRLYPYFWRLVVRKDYRGKGVGERLLNAVEQQLKEEGHKEIGIFIDETHEEVKGWYIKRGFKPTGLYRAMWKRINNPQGKTG